jgi:hypothetical protein
VPLPVERLPLHRWRPGTRALVVGSRDGAAPDHDLARHDGTSFRRTLTPHLVRTAMERAGTSILALAFSSTLAYPQAVATCLEVADTVIACTNGWGEADVLDLLLPRTAACQLVLGPRPGPLAARILAEAAHVEALACWSDPAHPLPPQLDLTRVAAVHLAPMQQAHADEAAMAAAYAAARASLPAHLPLYDETHRRDDCPCGATLVWRAGGRVRVDALMPDNRCSACGRSHAYARG